MTPARQKQLRDWCNSKPESNTAKALTECLDHIQKLEAQLAAIESSEEPPASKAKKRPPGYVNGTKPTEGEIMLFCNDIGLPVSDGKAMFLHFEENDWKRKGKPIKNWQLTIRKWKEFGYLPSQRNKRNGPPSTYTTDGREIQGCRL